MRWGRALVLAFAVSAMSCLAPTEIMLVLSTDVACTVVMQNGVAIAIGDPGDEDSGIATTTKKCSDDGGIGTLALLPHTSVDQPIGIRITLGVDAAADECGPNFEGCIVSRRSLRFDPHTPLTLPIDLDQACIGVPCTPYSTCVSGACVDAGVECDGSSCGIEDAGPRDAQLDASPPCQVVADTLVASSQTLGQGNPRVAMSADGWGVAFQTSTLGVLLSDVHVVNGVPKVEQPITLVSSSTANVIGPLAGDGTTYALSYATSSTMYAAIVSSSDGSPVGNPFIFTNATPAKFGMFSLDQKNDYAMAYISNAITDAFVTPLGAGGGNGVSLNASNVKDIALAQGSSGFYAATSNGTNVCTLYKCAYNGSAFACANAGGIPSTCVAMRVAERAGILSHVTQAGKILTVDEVHPLSAAVFGSNFDVVATRDVFHVVFVSNATSPTGIAIATYDGVSTSAPAEQQLALAGGIQTVLAMDVLPDGPNQTGYSIVYTGLDSASVTNVRFMHLCQ
jgi:hypothetical protein